MNCNDVDQDLSEESQLPFQVEEHVRGCNRCQEFVSALNVAQLVRAATLSRPGPTRSSPCGASRATTASPRASTTKWNSSTARPTASATSENYRLRAV